MSVNLVDTVLDNLKGPLLEQVAGWLGENPTKTAAAANDLIPAILSQLGGKVSGSDGGGFLSSILDQVDDGVLGKLGSLVKGGEAHSVASAGETLLSSIFGDGLVGMLVAGLVKSTGIGNASAKSLMGFLVPVIFASLKRLVSKNGLIPSVKWLAGLLSKQGPTLAKTLPKGFAEVLETASQAAKAFA